MVKAYLSNDWWTHRVRRRGQVKTVYLGIPKGDNKRDAPRNERKAKDWAKRSADAQADGTFDWATIYPHLTARQLERLGAVPPPRVETLGAFADDQLANWPRPLASSTATQYRGMLRLIQRHPIAAMPLGDILERDVTTFEKWLATATKPVYAAQTMILLRTLFKAAIRNRKITADASPMTAIPLTIPPKPKRRIYTRAELQAMLDNADEPDRASLLVMQRLGCRPSEVFG
jgi:hypothetical protein